MREERILVTDFASLKAGDLVEVEDCGWCNGGCHRGLLLAPYSGLVEYEDDETGDSSGWLLSPAPAAPCSNDIGYLIDAEDVADRIVYLISTGLDEQQAQREGADLGTAAEVHRRVLARRRP